jgi:hypothetical protein
MRGGYRDGPGFAEEAARFSRKHIRTPETKEFFKTSEFFLTIFGALLLLLASAVHDTFNAHDVWPLFTWLIAAYVVSRGIAKAGSYRSAPERLPQRDF